MAFKLKRRSFLFLALSMTSAATAASYKFLKPAQASTAKGTIYFQSGEVTANSAIVWARGNRRSRLLVDISTDPNCKAGVRTIRGPVVSADTDYTGKVDVRGLHPGTTYYYRVRLHSRPYRSLEFRQEGAIGRFRTAPAPNRSSSTRFVWAADLSGQGWGRNPNLQITAADGQLITGGYVIFEVMRKLSPDFAVFCGDMIYADNAIPPTKEIPASVGGGVWVNDPPKDFVAISLDEFRANWKYNLGDRKFQQFLAQTPIYVQWDDHEVTNNWYPTEILSAPPYNGLPASVLAERAKQAFLEYSPLGDETIFRQYRYGKHLDLFLLDERSFRGANDQNIQPTLEMLGEDQFQWLKRNLKTSRATWKVIATHDPLSIVTGGPGDYDAWAQSDPQVLGREAQLRDLLSFIKSEGIKNVVFITADVHFPAAISYHPDRATFKDFKPFWEFVIGPIHAGAFGPAGGVPLDPSFGPKYEFSIFPAEPNLPPPNNQFFGSVDIDGSTAKFAARIHDITGKVVYENVLSPA